MHPYRLIMGIDFIQQNKASSVNHLYQYPNKLELLTILAQELSSRSMAQI